MRLTNVGGLNELAPDLSGRRSQTVDEGMRFTDSYGEQSCTVGWAAFISGQSVYRTGMSKVGVPGVYIGWAAEDPTIAELSRATGLRHRAIR